MSKQDYYKILGLTKTASDSEIKTAYRKLASKFHPDKVTDVAEKARAEEEFKKINEAYECLGDSDKRDQYDSGSSNWSHNYANRADSNKWTFDDSFPNNSDLNDMFGQFFSKRNRSTERGPFDKNAGSYSTITISLTDAYIGRTIVVGNTQINLPKGIRTGYKVYSNGKLFTIEVKQDEKFKRSNDDLLVDVSISAIEAMLGIDATLEHLDGSKFQFSIPSGIQSGQIVKLSGKGMKNPETDRYGDLMVRIAITIPKALSEEEKISLKTISHRTTLEI